MRVVGLQHDRNHSSYDDVSRSFDSTDETDVTTLLGGIFVFSVLVLRERYARRSLIAAWAYVAFLTFVCLLQGRFLIGAVTASIRRPPEFDFLAFWLFGRVAVLHHDVYDATYFHAVGDGLRVSDDFTRELLNVGCVYPPPSLVWFLPLGAFGDVHAAVVFWSIAGVVVMAAALLALWRLCARAPSLLDLGAFVAVAWLMDGTAHNLRSMQLIYLALLWVVLGMRAEGAFRRGVFFGLALTVKPFLAFLLIQSLLRREWRTLLGAVTTVTALCLLVVPVLGPRTFARYFTDNPTSRFPASLYLDTSNQSILSWILRATDAHAVHVTVARHLPYLAIVAAIVAITLFTAARVANEPQTVTALLLTTGMIVYPQILGFYPVLLLAAFAVLWRRRAAIPGGDVGVATLLAVDVMLGNFESGLISLFAVALVWLALLALTFADGSRRSLAVAAPRRSTAFAAS